MKHIYEIKTRQEDDKNKILENPIFDFIIDKFLLIFLILIIFLWKSYGRAQIENIEKNLLRQKKEREKIRNYLWRILEITNADRVIYGEFHNGEIYSSGDHKLKFSARVEVKEEGIASIYNTIQDIPGENFDSEIEEFNQKNT